MMGLSIDREKVIKELGDLCEYMFHEYKVCYHGDENDTYSRFLTVNNALNLLKEQPEIVRCKDCKHRRTSEKCVLAAISEEKDFPLFMLDNRGNWFCADGERKNDGRSRSMGYDPNT